MPTRLIEGQATKLARTIHTISHDPIHDEIVVGNPVAQAILVFRGGADGAEPPIRIIQGPKTMLWDPDHVDVDPVHNEIFVPERDSVLVFPREANGDVAPIRVIQGPDTQLVRPRGISTVPDLDLIVVSVDTFGAEHSEETYGRRAKPGETAFLIFNRTDNGNVKPLRIVGHGLKSRFSDNNAGKSVVSPKGWIVVGLGSGGDRDNPFKGVGVWSVNDTGDVPPRWVLTGPKTMLMDGASAIALNSNAKELIVRLEDGSFAGYSFPEIF